jgi:hypothetical protein
MSKIYIYQSDEPNNFFAPHWKFYFYEAKFENTKVLGELKDIVLSKEREIIRKFPLASQDGGTGLGSNSLTSKFLNFNIFDWVEEPCVVFQNFVRDEYKKFIDLLSEHDSKFIPEKNTYVAGWANVLRKGQKINSHWHSCTKNSYLGAHFCVSTNDTFTVYENPYDRNDLIKFSNEPGKLLFFQNYMAHSTTEHRIDDERITLAMDIFTEKAYNDPVESKYAERSVRFV